MGELNHPPRLGIFGGTFNPVHLGHMIMAQDAMEAFDLSKVLFMPCARPPHKPDAALAPAHHRFAMLEAAIEGDLRFEVSDMELQRGGTSYTIDTLRAMRAEHPGVELFFIIGADSLGELHLWREIEALLALCRIVTMARPGVKPEALQANAINLRDPWPEQIQADIRVGHLVEVSSTDIRYRAAEGMAIRYLVPPAVDMYIAEHSLYRR
jgi:nicotinate-nucleotide adenylyltransferase